MREKLRETLAELLQDSFTEERPTDTRLPSVERHFSAREQELLTSGARGYLLSLIGDGQIGRTQMELIIQYVSLFWDAPVDIRDLEDLLDQVVFGFHPDELDAPEAWSGRRRH